MADLGRDAPPERREGRNRLSVDDPRTKKCLAALDLSGLDVTELSRFSNRLHREADAWMRRGGFGERGRISKLDAHRQFVAAFGEPRKLNRLATYRPGGAR